MNLERAKGGVGVNIFYIVYMYEMIKSHQNILLPGVEPLLFINRSMLFFGL